VCACAYNFWNVKTLFAFALYRLVCTSLSETKQFYKLQLSHFLFTDAEMSWPKHCKRFQWKIVSVNWIIVDPSWKQRKRRSRHWKSPWGELRRNWVNQVQRLVWQINCISITWGVYIFVWSIVPTLLTQPHKTGMPVSIQRGCFSSRQTQKCFAFAWP